MASTDFTKGDGKAGFRLSAVDGDILLEAKRTSNANELRGTLLSLAYALLDEPVTTRAVCALTDTRLSAARIQEELARFHETSNGRYRDRLFLVLVDAAKVVGDLPSSEPGLDQRIVAGVAHETKGGVGARVPQQLVKAAAIQAWVSGADQLRAGQLLRATGASKPTVAAAIRSLLQVNLLREAGGHYELPGELPWQIWRRLAEEHGAQRKPVRFADPSGQARTPAAMLGRLIELQAKGVALAVDLGGVFGAKSYDADLDITAAPRLDLCVYDGDLDFVRRLDAGLKPTERADAKAVLVIHHTRRLHADDQALAKPRPASVLDCLADLLEIGLQAEARDFVLALQRKRLNTSCKSFDA